MANGCTCHVVLGYLRVSIRIWFSLMFQFTAGAQCSYAASMNSLFLNLFAFSSRIQQNPDLVVVALQLVGLEVVRTDMVDVVDQPSSTLLVYNCYKLVKMLFAFDSDKRTLIVDVWMHSYMFFRVWRIAWKTYIQEGKWDEFFYSFNRTSF